MLLFSVLKAACPNCQADGISRVASLRPPSRCSACGAEVVRAPHPLGDAIDVVGPPFFVVSLLLSFFHWSLWPLFVVVAGVLVANARIPLMLKPEEAPESAADRAEQSRER